METYQLTIPRPAAISPQSLIEELIEAMLKPPKPPPSKIILLLRELRAWQAHGHPPHCMHRRCDYLRQAASGFLMFIEGVPKRYGANGDFCGHAVELQEFCKECRIVWLGERENQYLAQQIAAANVRRD